MLRFGQFITEDRDRTILTHKGYSVIHSVHSREQLVKRNRDEGKLNDRRTDYLFRKAVDHAIADPYLHNKEAMFYSKSVDHAFVGAVDHEKNKLGLSHGCPIGPSMIRQRLTGHRRTPSGTKIS